MAISVSVEPFEAEFLGKYDDGSWNSVNGTLTISFFGTEIWELVVPEGGIQDCELSSIAEIAKEELGKIIAERLSQRIKPSEWGGIQIDR